MKKNIHFFDQGEASVKPQVLERIGIRGRLAMELADLDLPILPGFLIDADVAAHLADCDIWGALRTWTPGSARPAWRATRQCSPRVTSTTRLTSWSSPSSR